MERKYDDRHGGPFDRGAADSYYQRPIRPHYFRGSTYSSEEVTEENMTSEEIEDYLAGYQENERSGAKKDYG